MRIQRADTPGECPGAGCRVEPPLVGLDLRGDRHALLRLLRTVRPRVEGLDEKFAAELREPRRERAEVVVRPDLLVALQADRTGVELRSRPHDRDPGDLVARLERALDRRRAPPARQQRRMDVEHRMLRQERVLDQRAERADQDLLGPSRPDPRASVVRVDRVGLEDLDPQLASRLGNGRRLHLPPAPTRPVGPSDDERRGVRARGKPPQDGNGELRRAHVDGPHGGDLIEGVSR